MGNEASQEAEEAASKMKQASEESDEINIAAISRAADELEKNEIENIEEAQMKEEMKMAKRKVHEAAAKMKEASEAAEEAASELKAVSQEAEVSSTSADITTADEQARMDESEQKKDA